MRKNEKCRVREKSAKKRRKKRPPVPRGRSRDGDDRSEHAGKRVFSPLHPIGPRLSTAPQRRQQREEEARDDAERTERELKTRKKEHSFPTCGGNGVRHMGTRGCVSANETHRDGGGAYDARVASEVLEGELAPRTHRDAPERRQVHRSEQREQRAVDEPKRARGGARGEVDGDEREGGARADVGRAEVHAAQQRDEHRHLNHRPRHPRRERERPTAAGATRERGRFFF